MRKIIEAASGTTEDILKITVWLHDGAHRKVVNQEWLSMFPDAGSRPARHTFVNQELMGGALVQCEFWAVLNGGQS
jgi:enamine deaminase RidA (YjgF/YER057c/UK114 family)